MPRFALNETIETREPTIAVEPGLGLGRHGFQLEVFDEAGNRSRPAVAIVEVQRETVNPTTPVVGSVRPPVGPVVRAVASPIVAPPDAANVPGEPEPSGPAAAPSAKRGPKSRRSRRKE